MTNELKKPSKDFQTRLDTAKKYRDAVRDDLEEALFFISPGRENDLFDRRPEPADEAENDTYMSLPEDLASDFAADLVTYFTPAESTWTNYIVTAPVPKEAARQVTELVSERETEIQEMIEASNYNDVAPQIMFEANHGTVAMWVEQAHLTQPLHIDPVPPHELLITPGHMGILDRFREKHVLAQHLPVTFDKYPEVDLSDQRLQTAMGRPGQTVKCCWGFWVNWTDPGNPKWMMEATVDGIGVMPNGPVEIGPIAGSCPLHVGRFNPQIGKPWGRGPAMKALPDMRVLDAIEEKHLEAMDQALSNTFFYADDGAMDFENGVEPDRAYAIRNFDRTKIYELNKNANLQESSFTIQQREDRIRACFYQDGPRQRGDTPPTASQWLDERRRVQQRLGKPSAPLWKEFFLPFIQRVENIGVQTGKFDAEITNDGEIITVKPVSPLQKAQNQDKVLVSKSNLDTAFAVFGESLPQVIDMGATIQNHIDTSGDELTVVAQQQTTNEPPDTPQ